MKSHLGMSNPNWRGGKPKCKTCGNEVWYGISTCRSCHFLKINRKEGTKKKTREGYVLIYIPTHTYAKTKRGQLRGWYQEHRLVVERSIGRLLTRSEVVHHKNGIKFDNRIENLELLSSNSVHIHLEQKGRTKSSEFKKRMSERQKGNKHWLGKKHSEETKIKMSLARKQYWKRKNA